MSFVRGRIDVCINLSKTGCYFMQTGRCSLDVVSDFYISSPLHMAPGDLLYCPRLYSAMKNNERMKPLAVIPCECGHAEVVSGQQRACIASKKMMEIAIRPAGRKIKETCPACKGQITFEQNSTGTLRTVPLRVCVEDEDEDE